MGTLNQAEKMKLLPFFAAVALAQKKGGKNKNKNKNKNDYGSPYPIVIDTTEKPTTKKPVEQVYGDPHFMVSSIGQEPVCFDYNPPPGSTLMLLSDPSSSLLVRGRISAEIGHQNKTFIEEITFMSPGGSELTFDPEGAHIHGQNVRNNFQQEDNETFKFGDLTFTENWNADGTRDRVIVKITDGPKFIIKAKVAKSSMAFGIVDLEGLSPKCKGILGNFIKSETYHILPREEENQDGEEQAFIINNNIAIPATKKDFHKTSECWTVSNEEDVQTLLRNI